MPGNAASFEYTYRFTPLLEELRKRLGPDWREFLNQATEWDLMRDDELEGFLGRSVVAGIYGVKRTSGQTITNNSEETVTFTTEELTNGGADVTWNGSTAITINTDGIYLVMAQGDYASSSSTGVRRIQVRTDGSTIEFGATGPGTANVNTRLSCAGALSLSATQYLELRAYQNNGSNIDLQTARMQVNLLGTTQG